MNIQRVLIVEDEYLVAMDEAGAFESAGIVVVGPVASVHEALDVLATGEQIDAAVLDVNLGDETVFPVCDALTSRGVRFVFVTGYGPDDIPAAYRHVERLEKPVDPAQLIRAVSLIS